MTFNRGKTNDSFHWSALHFRPHALTSTAPVCRFSLNSSSDFLRMCSQELVGCDLSDPSEADAVSLRATLNCQRTNLWNHPNPPIHPSSRLDQWSPIGVGELRREGGIDGHGAPINRLITLVPSIFKTRYFCWLRASRISLQMVFTY